MPLKLLRCVVLLSVFAKHLPMYKIFDLCIYLRSEASWIIAVLFGIHGNVLLLTKWNELKQNLLSSCYKSKIQYSNENYPALCHHFRLPSLQHRRQVADLIFQRKCVHSHLDSSYLVGNIQYQYPSRSLRNHTPFRISNTRINIRKYSVLTRCMTTFNALYLTEPICDIFIGANTFRSVVQKHFYI